MASEEQTVNGSLEILNPTTAHQLYIVREKVKSPKPDRSKVQAGYLPFFDSMLKLESVAERTHDLESRLRAALPNKEEWTATLDLIDDSYRDPDSPGLNSYFSSNSYFVEEDEEPVPDPPWVDPPDPIVYQGLAGDIVRAIGPHTEADPLALLACVLGMAGSVLGSGPHVLVEGTRHYGNEFMLLVGRTAFGRKGTAVARIRSLFKDAFPVWGKNCIASGLSSGEGLISPVRDRETKVNKKGEPVVVHEGVKDKRKHVIEGEFAGVIAALKRDGNKLSALMRDAWDHNDLNTMTKDPMKATNPHISIVANITAEELKSKLHEVDCVNGLMNRFLFFAVRRWQLLPWGGEISKDEMDSIETRLGCALDAAQSNGWPVELSDDAKGLWEHAYRSTLSVDSPGILGHITTRGAPHVLRLSLCYAMLDGVAEMEGYGEIETCHLEAALALWEMSRRCAAFLFGELTGNPDSDKILAALKGSVDGMTRTEISDTLFDRNASKARLDAALGLLKSYGMITETKELPPGGKGRPTFRYRVRSTNLTKETN